MENKHTPGEWYSKDGQIYPMETGKTLAVIPYYDKKNEEQQANARLIAAAPDLLENLTRIIDRIEENKLQDQFPSAYRRAIDAIQKAINP